MEKKKNKVLLIVIIVVAVLLVLGVTFALLYFNTDLFKDSRTLFYKYMLKNEELGQVFDFKNLEAYDDKVETTPHTSTTQISFNSQPAIEQISTLNKLKITLEEKNDTTNKNASTDLTVQYSDFDLFKASAIKNGDLYGFLCNEIITKYVAVENNNLKDFASKLGVENVENVPNKLELNQYDNLFTLTEEQETNLVSTYKKVLFENIPKELYTKQKDVPLLINDSNIKTNTYSLTLNEKQLNSVYQALLEATKNDPTVLNIIKEKAKLLGYEDFQLDELTTEFQENIQKVIDNINKNELTDSQALKIVLYTAKNKVLKTDIIIEETNTMSIQYKENDTEKKMIVTLTQTDSTDSYTIDFVKNVTDDKTEFTITTNATNEGKEAVAVYKMEKTGNLSSNEIQDAMSFGTNDGTNQFRMDYIKKTTFTDNIEVQKLDASNSVTLNAYPAQDIQNLLSAIMTKTQQVFEQKMQTLGIGNSATKQNIAAFNSQFMAYSGSDVAGSTVKTLITQINTSNATYTNTPVTVDFGQSTNISEADKITGINNLVNPSSKYTVTLEYNSQGLVNKVIIKEKV